MSDSCRRALVTGASGFIASWLIDDLAARGVHVRGLVRAGGSAPRGCVAVRGDVTDRPSVQAAVQGCDVVFHCAWGGQSLSDARRINVDGTRNVVIAAAEAGVRRVVHLSSMAVHGYDMPPVLTEQQPLCFTGAAYGVSKAEGERAAFEAARGVDVVALRPTLVYGPRSPLWVLSYFNRVKHEQLALVNNGSGLANLVMVDDLVRAMWAAAVTPRIAGQAFLISGEGPVTWREYIGAFADLCGKPLPRTISVARARCEVQWWRGYSALTRRPRKLEAIDLQEMTQHVTVRIDKARRLLGYQPQVSFAAGMQQCAAWLRAEGVLAPRNGASDDLLPARHAPRLSF